MQKKYFLNQLVCLQIIRVSLKKKKKENNPNTQHDWLIYYILEPITKIVGGFYDKIVSFLTPTYLNKLCMGEERN